MNLTEAKASPGTGFSRGEKRLECMRKNIGRHALAVVQKCDPQVVAGWEIEAVIVSNAERLHMDLQTPAKWHSMTRVRSNVQNRELKLGRFFFRYRTINAR
jgi:hypothetical protein